jgi:hypothetical protein
MGAAPASVSSGITAFSPAKSPVLRPPPASRRHRHDWAAIVEWVSVN